MGGVRVLTGAVIIIDSTSSYFLEPSLDTLCDLYECLTITEELESQVGSANKMYPFWEQNPTVRIAMYYRSWYVPE